MQTRRDFLAVSGAVVSAGLLSCKSGGALTTRANTKIPALITTWGETAKKYNEVPAKMLAAGENALDAVEKGVNEAENDPENMSVGYGGIPNEKGEVELDAMIMWGPTHKAASVAALKNIKTPISVARKVMEKTKHSLLVGEGALEFALGQGFKNENLLTEKAKKVWQEWLANSKRETFWTHDTIGMVAIDRNSDIAAACSTSGLGFKIPGRVGDSPIIGCGAYCDNDIGGAAATGNGDVMMRFCLSFLAVEFMRDGLSPDDACQKALNRLGAKGYQTGAALVAMNKRGEFGAGKHCIEKFSYAVWNEESAEVRYK
ncbi:N(4)-(beta-N-acetylglucosaminyl)-L-asparaginase [Candidatus Peregrinibacteria bacterium]|nr:N(4)-(beta-N-acetylglucosaminyl)-L-asparaginase [Candidatus Peregrinibacteria bacterium]